jgi:hypothetical protein
MRPTHNMALFLGIIKSTLQLGRPRRRWKYNTGMNLREIG